MLTNIKEILLIVGLFILWNSVFSQNDTIIFDSLTQKEYHGRLINKKKIGIWEQYDNKSNLCEITNYYLDSIFQVITFKSNISNGWKSNINNNYINSITSYYKDDTGETKIHGRRYIYNSNQSIARIDNYEKGILHGISYVFFKENNSIKLKMNYNLGKLDGEWCSYFFNQKNKEKGTYINGIKNGYWKYFYSNGNIRKEGEYLPEYYLIKYKDFVNFKLIVINKTYKDTIPENKYTRQMHETIDYLYKSNKTFPYKMYLKTGEWIYYNENGRIEKKEYYNKEGELLK